MSGGLVFNKLVCGYGDTMVVRGVSGAVAPGRVLGVLGRNGVGKTTLVRALTGFLPVREGEVRWQGESLAGVPAHVRWRQGLAYAPQENVVFGDLSVQENLWLHRSSPQLDVYEPYLQQFPRIRERLAQRAGSLSGGERKLLSFTRTLGAAAALSILDEPTEGVQPENIDRMAACVRERRAQGGGFLIVEQNLSFLEAVADEVLVLDHGECVLQGRMADLGRERLEVHLVV
jgi:ABC-type branched-subunit amino acid transport system ATPase component